MGKQKMIEKSIVDDFIEPYYRDKDIMALCKMDF